jgi:primosomal protein N' (replication factor Y) (superfamily II helicase)
MKTKQEKLIAKIIPAIKLPRNVEQVFSYTIPKEFEKKIKVGMLVEIPFRNKNIIGAVRKIKKEKAEEIKYKLKDIISVSDEKINLTEQQIQLAEFIADYYYAPLSLAIKIMIPQIAKKEARKIIELNSNYEIANIDKIEIAKLLKEIKKERETLLIHNLQSLRHNLYYKIIKKLIRQAHHDNNKQALILFPESFDIYNFAKFYMDKLGKDKVAILTSELTKNQYFDEWKRIKSGLAQIIIGTRQAVFAPFQNLKLIIADDEHNSSYKQWDQSPRYHGINACGKLAEIWKAKIILSSPAPSIENYYRIKNKIFVQSNSCDKALSKTEKPALLILININDERKKGNYSALSEKLKNDLIENIYQKKQAVIFIPRIGENTITKCNDCNFIAECEECGNALVLYNGFLHCTRCNKKFDLIEKCPKCHGHNIKSFGHGSESVESEIKKLFENKNIKIQRLDSLVAKESNKQAKIYKDFINRKIDILIGTQMVLKNWNMKNLSILAVIFPEIIFHQPNFRSKEKSFQFLNSLSLLADNTKVIIQTNNIENPIYKLLKIKNKNDFYKREIQDRRASLKIGYPPFSQLIKLIYKDHDLEKCKSEAAVMHKMLQEKISNDKELKASFEITKPFPASNFREYGKYRYNIIARSICKDLELRNSLLNCIKKNWIVDIDPDNL